MQETRVSDDSTFFLASFPLCLIDFLSSDVPPAPASCLPPACRTRLPDNAFQSKTKLIGSQAGDLASETVGATVEEADEEGFIDQAKQLFQSTANQARDAATQAQESLRTTQANIPLPDVPSIEMPNLNPLSQERLDLDEQLFGRPSRLG